MKKLTYILPIFAASLLVSCGGEDTTTPDGEPGKASHETTNEKGAAPGEEGISNTFSIDTSTVVVKWTGFKTPEKIGVDGEFKSYSIIGYTDNATSISDMMTGTEIILDVNSTKTGDEARDGKIISSFFGNMTNTNQISAHLVSMEGETEGKAQVEIKMNDVSFTQEMEWTYREDLSMFILQGVVNIPDWNAILALDKLTEACFEKHQGKTWPDVEVRANVKVIVTPAQGV